VIAFITLPALGLIGAAAMLDRKRYKLAYTSVICLIVPILGPCFGLTLPLDCWLLVLLRRPSIRDTFETSNAPFAEPILDANAYETAEAAIDAAGKLNINWDEAVTLYRLIATRWPEHGSDIENCSEEIPQKQAAASRPGSAETISTAFACKRHASVGLVPAGQQLTSYAPPIVANCSDDFRCAGCPKEIILT
jgi:hypothetical protein